MMLSRIMKRIYCSSHVGAARCLAQPVTSLPPPTSRRSGIQNLPARLELPQRCLRHPVGHITNITIWYINNHINSNDNIYIYVIYRHNCYHADPIKLKMASGICAGKCQINMHWSFFWGPAIYDERHKRIEHLNAIMSMWSTSFYE